jgi:hypothetical protein
MGIREQENARDAFACCNIYINNDWQNNIWRKWNADGVGRATIINLSEFCILSDRAKKFRPEANAKQSE